MNKVWKGLEEELNCNIEHRIVTKLIEPNSIYRMFLGIERIEKVRMFMIQVPYKYIKKVLDLPKTNGLYCIKKIYGVEKENYMTLVLQSSETEYNEIFSFLIEDIIKYIMSINDEGKIIDIINERLLVWKDFLDSYGDVKLGKEAQRGLFGELWFLRNYIISNLQGKEAVKCWTGPDRLAHDFQLELCSIEIKSSISKKHKKVHISNERQLDDRNIHNLYLMYLSLDINVCKGETLVELIDDIRQHINNDIYTKRRFEDKLIEAGYLDIYKEYYSKIHYLIRDVVFYRVKEGFPRIIESNVPEGVGDIKYTVALDKCSDFFVNESEVKEKIGGK